MLDKLNNMLKRGGKAPEPHRAPPPPSGFGGEAQGGFGAGGFGAAINNSRPSTAFGNAHQQQAVGFGGDMGWGAQQQQPFQAQGMQAFAMAPTGEFMIPNGFPAAAAPQQPQTMQQWGMPMFANPQAQAAQLGQPAQVPQTMGVQTMGIPQTKGTSHSTPAAPAITHPNTKHSATPIPQHTNQRGSGFSGAQGSKDPISPPVTTPKDPKSGVPNGDAFSSPMREASPRRHLNHTPSAAGGAPRTQHASPDKRRSSHGVASHAGASHAANEAKLSGRTPNVDWYARKEQGGRMYLEDTYSTEAVDGNMLLFAVFDGHGGSKASEFCQNHLLNNIRRHINPAKERNPTGAMKAGFLQTEMQFRSLAEQLGWTDGTTAVVMCLCDGWIHVAHVGDSRLVLTRDGHPPSCQALTEDHKPDNHHEYQLIHSRGGQVQQRLGDVSRVVPGYLAVSRSIGDIRAKPVVSAEPEINSFKLPSNTRALVLASDGLWDVVSNQMVADICARCTNARQATDMLVETALQMRSTDNVTALVVFP